MPTAYFRRFIFIVFHIFILKPACGQDNYGSLMGLISAKEIAEITQLATDLAAQTMQGNSELLSKPGRPDVRPISLNQSPSEMIGQSLTNIWQPASQQFASALAKNSKPLNLPKSNDANDEVVPFLSMGSRQFKPLAVSKPSMPAQTLNSLLNLGRFSPNNQGYSSSALPLASSATSNEVQRQGDRGRDDQPAAMNSIMELASTFLGGGNDNNYQSRVSSLSSAFQSDGGGGNAVSQLLSMGSGGRNSNNNYKLPNLRQFLPMADRNFGFKQGEGCLPFVGEFMRIAYGNCVKQADQRTWDTWGKEIQNALMGGKIDLLKASRETCKKGAEREQCGQVRRAVSECDIIGSIQLVSNLQRSIDRCDDISGLIDQNPVTVLNQMNGLIGGEMAQGFLNNFLGK